MASVLFRSLPPLAAPVRARNGSGYPPTETTPLAEAPVRQLRPRAPAVQVAIPPPIQLEEGPHSPSIDLDDSPLHSPSPSPPASTTKLYWIEVFHPLSLTRDMGSLTIEPHNGWESVLRQHGLFYVQLYNASKEVFAAGSTNPFTSCALDTLALDAGLVRSWQHLGRAISHSPQTIVRAYLHAKVRCHTALTSCRNNSYGTREEYRVSGTFLAAIHDEMITRLAIPLLSGPERDLPFFIHRTGQFLDWIRWNMNRLCLGFEMVYTLRPHTVVRATISSTVPASGWTDGCGRRWRDPRWSKSRKG
ncbi:hypothetical protein BJY01DRAFT_246101 [Aspergillus pseudoustus]|uniref:Uncharacterized protein n=1 Tax=Aspergillus pseudoustus TaxID=1810923 RepID=A0ABR4KC62_9EURO